MKTYFVDNKSDKLIIFLNGWGLDEIPFKPFFKSSFDILFISDYSKLNDVFNGFDFVKYSKKVLMAYSYGVFMTNVIESLLPQNIDKRIAINGTSKPIDKMLGINPKIFDMTLNNISEDSMRLFYSKMFDNNIDDEYFGENLPSRSIESCLTELQNIKSLALKDSYINSLFVKTIISMQDKIIPTKSQQRFWDDKNIEKKEIQGGHFPFYKFSSFDEIINL